MTDDVPPSAVDTERGVLGAMILDVRAISAVQTLGLEGYHFYHPPHRKIYTAIVSLHFDEGEAVDQLTLGNFLKRLRQFDEAGGDAYISRLAAETATWANVRHHTRIVLEKAALRELMEEGYSLVQRAASGRDSSERISEDLHQRITRRTLGHREEGWVSPRDGFAKLKEAYERAKAMGLEWAGHNCGFPAINDMMSGLCPGELTILGARPNIGKAQPVDEPVLTPQGWKEIGTLKIGDRVASADGTWACVNGLFPQGPKEVFRVEFAGGGYTHCCNDHLWLTTTLKERRRKLPAAVRPLSEIRKSLNVQGTVSNHHIPWARPIEFEESSLPLDPYLIGLYIADGCRSISAVISNPEPDIQTRLRHALPAEDTLTIVNGSALRIRRKQRNNMRSATSGHLKLLGLLGTYSHERFIPRTYLLGSVPQRLALLQGLCDADGHAQASGVEYSTASPQLREDITFLVGSLGGVVSWQTRTPTYTHAGEKHEGRVAYRGWIRFGGEIYPVSSQKHLKCWRPKTKGKSRPIRNIVAVGERASVCISVDHPSGLYVTRDFAVTHNTTLALQMATTVAESGAHVAFFSIEMTTQQLLQRLACIEAGVDVRRLRSGRLGDEEHERFESAVRRLSPLPLHLDYTPALTVTKATAKLETLLQDNPVGLVIIDYMQLMDGPGDSKNQVLEAVSTTLQNLAKSLNLHFLVLSQLSRGVETREDRRPRMSDLRDSGGIEQSADNVLLIHRPGKYDDIVETWKGDESDIRTWVQIIHDKTRFGPTGAVELVWVPETAQFASKGATLTAPNISQGSML